MKKIFAICAALLVAASVVSIFPSRSDFSLYDNVIRLHILANSDSETDQALKLYVRDSILSKVDSIVRGAESKREAEALLRDSLDELTAAARSAVHEYGADESVTVTLTEEEYPRRSYGIATLPSGEYTSLRIMLGEAEGANWWCVLFPRMCTAPAMSATNDEDEFIEVGFTPSQYRLITDSDDKRYVIKFRILELLEELWG